MLMKFVSSIPWTTIGVVRPGFPTSFMGSSLVLTNQQTRYVRSISGRMFYKRRPRQHKPKPVPKTKWLEGRSHAKGVVTKVFIANPVKPNSAQRRCARVKLSSGRVVLAYIPGIGHNLQVHSLVLLRGGRTRDLIGARYKVVRGVLDCLPVKSRLSSLSKYGVKRSREAKTQLKAKFLESFHLPSSNLERQRFFSMTGIYVAPGEQLPNSFAPKSILRKITRPRMGPKMTNFLPSYVTGYAFPK